MSRKIICVFLALLMCLSLFPVGVLAAEGSPDEELLIEELSVEEIPAEAPAEELPEKEQLPEETLEETVLTAETEDGVLPEIKYLVYKNGDFEESGCSNYTTGKVFDNLPAYQKLTLPGGWYVLDGTKTIGERVVFSGDAHLILVDGCNYNFAEGIEIHKGTNLTIYAQSISEETMGRLTADSNVPGSYGAGIGGKVFYSSDDDMDDVHSGNVYIHGGYVIAKGGYQSAGIGGGSGNTTDWDNAGDGGTVCIYGGHVEAYGGVRAAGIGGGGAGSYIWQDSGSGGNVSVYGGYVYAKGGDYAAGIGSGAITFGDVPDTMGKDVGEAGSFTIYGGEVVAVGGDDAAGIGGANHGDGGTVTINGGKVTAQAGYLAAGIGGGNEGAGGSVYLNGGELDVTGDPEAYAIGGGDGNTHEGVVYVGSNRYVFDYLKKQFVNPDGGSKTWDGRSWNEFFLMKDHVHVKIFPDKSFFKETNYLAYDETTKSFKEKTCTVATPVAGEVMTLTTWNPGWYVADSDVTIDDAIRVSGNVNLIIKDGCTFNANNGILVAEGSSLKIYAQSTGYATMGKLYAVSNTDFYAGIGTNGNITVYGGYVKGTGGKQAAGIGGGSGRNGSVTIYGGIVYGYGGDAKNSDTGTDYGGGAGIGGGYNGIGTVTVYGGSVYGYGGADGAAGIGGGKGKNGTVTVYGGSVEGHGGSAKAKDVREAPSGGGAGVGGGYNGVGVVKLYGGSTYGYGGLGGAAGIGGGCSSGRNSGGCSILIDNKAYAIGYGGDCVFVDKALIVSGVIGAGPGVGLGLNSTVGTIEIKSGTLRAFGGNNRQGTAVTGSDGIRAAQITVNPYADYSIQVTTDDNAADRYYYKKTVLTSDDFKGQSGIHFLTVKKTSQMIEDEDKSSDPTTPETGDNSSVALWAALLVISGSALAGTAIYGRKRKNVK